MSYRKLTVDGKEYEYSIGRKYVKFRGIEPPIEKSEIGFELGYHQPFFRDVDHSTGEWIVRPGDIAYWLKHGTKRPIPKCKCGAPGSERLRSLPYQREIEGKKILTHYCDDCLDANAVDI